jgi:hypothetical protein
MKKILLFILLFSLGLTSCVEIVEEITLHNNKSGNIKYKLETNQFASFLNTFSEFIDGSIENQMKSQVEAFALNLKSQEGIDSVRFNMAGTSGNTLLEFSFTNPDALNNAIYKIFRYEKNMFSPKYIKLTNYNFQRKNFAPLVQKYLEKEKIELQTRDIVNLIAFKTIIKYPVEIKKYRGDNLEISDNRKSIIQTNKLSDVLENKTNVAIKSRQKMKTLPSVTVSMVIN